MTVPEIMQEVENICKKHGAKELFLFGSYADGTYTDSSDIDFVVKGCGDIDALREEIEEIPTLMTIDLFDYDSCQNPYLKEDMDRYGKQIY